MTEAARQVPDKRLRQVHASTAPLVGIALMLVDEDATLLDQLYQAVPETWEAQAFSTLDEIDGPGSGPGTRSYWYWAPLRPLTGPWSVLPPSSRRPLGQAPS